MARRPRGEPAGVADRTQRFAARLVDYDGMFLPKFSGGRSPEMGHKNYQHPERTADDYGEYIDNFPSLVIYLSLLAVASDPNLWHFYNDDNLIFTRDDYADPDNSEVFQQLKRSSDARVAKLTESLEDCCSMPVEEVPDLETILRSIPQSTVGAPQAAPIPPTPPPAGAATSSSHRPAGASASGRGGYRQVLQGRPSSARTGSTPVSTSGGQASAPPSFSAPVSSPAGVRQSQSPRTPSQGVTFAQMRENFRDAVAELRFHATYYEFKKVALGVGIIAATVFVLLAAMMALAISQIPS